MACCRCYTVARMPRWNPINVCSYHLQEAGATPVQEIAYALCTAMTMLDAVRDSGQVRPERMADVVGRISFFVNAGVRFVEEMCKMRAFGRLWDTITRERYGIADPDRRRFRYGVQVNSLGLTEAQPENNVQRIVLEMLAVTLSKDARARAIQLPAWNEALGLPRPVDQQWSLRIQQVLAYESDLLDYDDLFNGSAVVEAKTAELIAGAQAEIAAVRGVGGMVRAVESGYVKAQLVASLAARHARIESGEQMVVGVNCFQRRDNGAVAAALGRLKAEAARQDVNLMDATLACTQAGATTGEWSGTLREVFGEYRAPTGLQGGTGGRAAPPCGGSPGGRPPGGNTANTAMSALREAVRAAAAEDVHCVGLSILSGGHAELVPPSSAASWMRYGSRTSSSRGRPAMPRRPSRPTPRESRHRR